MARDGTREGLSRGMVASATALVLRAVLVVMMTPAAVVSASQGQPAEVTAVAGRSVDIPCHVSSIEGNINFVLWKKHGYHSTVASVDFRADEPIIKFDSDVFGSRAEYLSEGGAVSLRVLDVTVEDAGAYTCVMDVTGQRFHIVDTRLNVIVPPGEPIILGKDGREMDHELGPYNEGSTVSVTCQVEGGQPPPRVSWYREEQLLDEDAERQDNSVVKNTLRLGPLTRKDLGAKFLCHAFNSDQVGPLSKEVTLQMHLKPLTVKMKKPTHPLVVGREYNITCESREGFPPAVIEWWLLGKKLNPKLIYNVTKGNVSVSTLRFRPKVKHAGELLECKAKSSVIVHPPLVDSWRLQVQYSPEVRLQAAPGYDLHNVREGDNVTLDCKVKAIPKAINISWYHKLMEVEYNTTAGVVRSGHALHLTTVSRRQSGSYTCHATNKIGTGESDPIVLNVMYTPFCDESKTVVRGAAKHDDVELVCRVRGSPGNITFSWFYHSTQGQVRIPEDNYTTIDLTSVLTYNVHNEEDYRKVMCYGKNVVGDMKKPCQFEVIPAGKPEALNNCSVTNRTTDVLFASCNPGYDGGLDQSFVVQVFEVTDNDKFYIHNFTENEEPKFTVDSLRAGAKYLLAIYAENEKGKSDKRFVSGFTLPTTGRPVHIFPITPVLGVLIGVVGALVLVAIVVVVVMKLKGDARRDKMLRHAEAEDVKLPHAPLHSAKDGEAGPDVILCRADAAYEDVDGIPQKLKHANIYETVPYDKEKSGKAENAERDDVEYAELTFNNGKNKNKNNKRSGGPGGANGVIRTATDSTIYAMIDHTRTAAQEQQQQQQQQQQKQKQQAPHHHHRHQQQQGNRQPKQHYAPQPGSKAVRPLVTDADATVQREPDEIPLMDAALESSV